MAEQTARSKMVDTSNFWRIIFPTLCVVILLFVLFIVFTMPDWALTCEQGLGPVRESIRQLRNTA